MKKNLLSITVIFLLMVSTINAQNILGDVGVDWNMDSETGWTLDATNSTNTTSNDLIFATVEGSTTVMRVTAPSGLGADMSAIIMSSTISSIPVGDYNIKMRFRNSAGGKEVTGGALEIRALLQDPSAFTAFNASDADAVGQIFGIFKAGGINATSNASWIATATISDSDTDNNFADTDEWVDVTLDFNIGVEVTNKSLKLLFRIGSAQSATENVSFEIDYINWSTGVSTDITDGTSFKTSQIYVVNNDLIISGIEKSEVYYIYNMSGEMVKQGVADSPSFSTSLDLVKGIYLVKVGSEVQKIAIE